MRWVKQRSAVLNLYGQGGAQKQAQAIVLLSDGCPELRSGLFGSGLLLRLEDGAARDRPRARFYFSQASGYSVPHFGTAIALLAELPACDGAVVAGVEPGVENECQMTSALIVRRGRQPCRNEWFQPVGLHGNGAP